MKRHQTADERQNEAGTGAGIDTNLTQLRSLAVRLAQRYPHLPPDAKPHASNIIQQSKSVHTEADYERLRPFIARAARQFRDCFQ